MQITCPCCFARFAIEAALTDEHARQAVAVALKMPPPLGDLTLRYLALFRAPNRALSWDRAARLLGDLLAPMQAGRIERHGRVWAAPLPAWQTAFEEMLARRDKLQLPLKSHGYLWEIVVAQANRVEADAERRAEDVKRQRAHRDGGGASHVGRAIESAITTKTDPVVNRAKGVAAVDALKEAIKKR